MSLSNSTESLGTVHYASPNAVAMRIKTGENYRDWAVIDVRDADFIGGNIPGCIRAPSSRFEEECEELVTRLKDVRSVIFHCALSQQRGPCAAEYYAERREEALRDGTIDSIFPFGTEAQANNEAQEILILQGGFTTWVRQFKDDPELVEGFHSLLWDKL